MMMTYRFIDRLKNELKNYRAYQDYLKQIDIKLDQLWYDLTGVKGVRYDKAPGTGQYRDEIKLGLLEKIDWWQAERNRVVANIEYIHGLLSQLTDEELEIIMEVYIEGNSIRKTADKLYISHPALSKRINKILKRKHGSQE